MDNAEQMNAALDGILKKHFPCTCPFERSLLALDHQAHCAAPYYKTATAALTECLDYIRPYVEALESGQKLLGAANTVNTVNLGGMARLEEEKENLKRRIEQVMDGAIELRAAALRFSDIFLKEEETD